ncbi:hypothetical protein D9M68_954430 [compost metagenome]
MVRMELAGATSTSSPEYMTPMRSQNSIIRPRSWVMNRTEKPRRDLSSTICSMMSRCTTTSSAVVGSSMMMRRGLSARAMAMQMRWRMPPEN